MEQSARLVTRLRQVLTPKGLDVVIPLSVESYNAFLAHSASSAASDLTRFQLPVPTHSPSSSSSTSATSAASGHVPPPRSSSLLVLVGNSKALWDPFLAFVRREIALSGSVAPDPIDRYVQQSVRECLEELRTGDGDSASASGGRTNEAAPERVYWVADTAPDKMVLAQKMALAAKQVSHCPPSQLCVHPELGPWLAFRCALVFASDGVVCASEDAQPLLCSHEDALHARITALMETAFAQASAANEAKNNTTGVALSPDAWRAWAMPRLAMAPNHPMTYSSEQLLYHYTKDRTFLAQVVAAQDQQLSMDFLRTPPSPHVVACRQLLQQVLGECAAALDDPKNHTNHSSVVTGLLLSGGLDTSILAEASAQSWTSLSLDKHGPARPILRFQHAFTLQAHESDAPDAAFAAAIVQRLAGVSLPHHHVLQPSLADLLTHASRVAYVLATCDPMELRNSLVIYATLAHAAALGVQRVVTGDGADELFGGYAFFQRMDDATFRRYREHLVRVMQFTAPALGATFGIEVVSPFLDPRVVAFAQSLATSELIGERTPVPIDGGVKHGKLVLRQAFPETFSQWRSKQPIEEGAGTTALRMGYFDAHWSLQEFAQRQTAIFQQHRVFVRDNEHLFFFEAFAEAFEHDLANVPKTRRVPASEDEDVAVGFCPACFFELSHPEQDFCITCGFWPTTCTATNDTQGYATQALAQLAQDKRRLLAGE